MIHFLLLNRINCLSKGCFSLYFLLCSAWSAKALCNCGQEWQGHLQTLLALNALGTWSHGCPRSPVLLKVDQI